MNHASIQYMPAYPPPGSLCIFSIMSRVIFPSSCSPFSILEDIKKKYLPSGET